MAKARFGEIETRIKESYGEAPYMIARNETWLEKYMEKHNSSTRSNVKARIMRADKMIKDLERLKTLKKSKREKKRETKKVKPPPKAPTPNKTALKRLEEIETNLEKANHATLVEYKEFLYKLDKTEGYKPEIYERADDSLQEVLHYLDGKRSSEPAEEAGAGIPFNAPNNENDTNTKPSELVAEKANLTKKLKKPNDVKNVAGAGSPKGGEDCLSLVDPCTHIPLSKDTAIPVLEKRIKQLKTTLITLPEKEKFTNRTRLDLMRHILNFDKPIDISFFKYQQNGQIYESLWDIVLCLGSFLRIKGRKVFPKKPNFIMIHGNLDGKRTIAGAEYTDPIKYLSARKVNESSGSGSSDTTFMYKNDAPTDIGDPCSSDIGITDKACSLDPPLTSSEETTGRNKIYFCSSKFFQSDDKKGITKDFDISKIFHSTKYIPLEDFEKHIILLVNNKEIVRQKLKSTRHPEIAEDAYDVFGMADLLVALKRLYNFVKRRYSGEITVENLTELFGGKEKGVNDLDLQYHQIMAVDKICESINEFKKPTKEFKSNKFLVGILPRGGKTYIAGGIVRDLQPKRVVILLGAKSETITQFIDDLFDYHKKGFDDFKEYTVIDVLDTKEIDYEIDLEKKYIFVMSIELFKMPDYYFEISTLTKDGKTKEQVIDILVEKFKMTERELVKKKYKDWEKAGKPSMIRKYLNGLKGLINDPKAPPADLIISDEAHLKVATAKGKKSTDKATRVVNPDEIESNPDFEIAQLEQVAGQVTSTIPIVFMTGTYLKPLKVFKIPTSNLIIWSYQDVQYAKELSKNIDLFKQNFGIYHEKAIEKLASLNKSLEEIEEDYKTFPKLNLITTHFNDKAKEAFEIQKGSKKGEPTIPTLFEVEKKWDFLTESPSNWWKGFRNPKGMAQLINFLSPTSNSTIEIDGKIENIDPVESAMTAVDMIAQYYGDRLKHFTTHFVTHSQLWFLPFMTGNPLPQRMTALAGTIFQNPWYRDNFVILAVSTTTDGMDIPHSKNRKILIEVKGKCGIFSWACPGKGSLKQCILDEEKYARSLGKGLIILAQNMLHLGISLPCVDIVVLLDDTANLDERIQKMYRALTQSTDKRAGFIIDTNYFRTVDAILDYQIAEAQSRDDAFDPSDVKTEISKMFNLYAIDSNQVKKYEARVEGESQIEQETNEHYKKAIKHSSSVIRETGDQLNMNIEGKLALRFDEKAKPYLLGMKEEQKKAQVRKDESGVEKAKGMAPAGPTGKAEQAGTGESGGAGDSGGAGSGDTEPPVGVGLINAALGLSDQDVKVSFIDSFRTLLKYAVFGTNYSTVSEFYEKLSEDKELQLEVYDILTMRGNVKPLFKVFPIDFFLSETLPGKTKKVKGKDEPVTNRDIIEKIIKKLNDFIEGDNENTLGSLDSYLKNGRKDNLFKDWKEDEIKLLRSAIEEFEFPAEEFDNTSIESIVEKILFDRSTDSSKKDYKKSAEVANKQVKKTIENFFTDIVLPNLKIYSESKNPFEKMVAKFSEETKGSQFEDVLKYINEHLAPKDFERHKYGEVFTPLTLVDEMLSKLPPEVWSKSDYKWLDPANGMGNFPIKALIGQNEGEFKYPGLLKGLKGKKDCKWIIENMLYMIDINPKNNAIARRLFEKLCPGAKPNIEQIDKKNGFLVDKPLVFNGKTVSQFDIIMGNPPFNRGGINRPDTRKIKSGLDTGSILSKGKPETIWDKFVIASSKLLKPSGYIVFIHPVGWFHSGDYDGVRDFLLSKQIDIIKIYKDDSQAVKEFSGSGKITVAYYILKNIKSTSKTIIQGTSGKKEELLLTNDSLILLNNSSIINKIIKKSKFWKENKNFKHVSVRCESGSFKQISGIYETGEIKVVKTSSKHTDADKPKIIVAGRNYPRVYYDTRGEYGLIGSGVNYWIGGKEDLDKMKAFLETRLSAFLTKQLKFRQNFVEFKYFPDVTLLDLEEITDESLAGYFGFSKEEIATIEATEYPKREYTFKEITCAELKKEKPEKLKEGGTRTFFDKTRKRRRV